MDITKYNFIEQLDNIITDINESSFIAIDGEFTGLDATEFGHTAPFDTAEERYRKIKKECPDFLLIQFGLCTFKVDEQRQKYNAKPYNFYVFPTPFNKHAPDRRFLCQTSSIDFLASQGFDFNKLFREGIPYLLPEHEIKLRADLQQKHELASKEGSFSIDRTANKSYIKIPEEQKSFINNICDQVTTYLEDEPTTDPLVLPPCNAFQRKLIYQTVAEKFTLAQLDTKVRDNKERYMEVTRAKSAEEQQKLQKERQNLEKMEIDIQVGFSKVIRAITASGKLVVGHNMFLDVCHVIGNFCCSLPDDADDFKNVTKSIFPRLLDTKLMANTQPLQGLISYSGLNGMIETLNRPPFVPVEVELAEGFERYHDRGGALHEAGYDAFVTGCCFVTMVNHLGTFQNPPTKFVLPSSNIVQPFVNKLFLMRINDIPYLNLDGPDLKGNREHVFHVTFPRQWTASDLYSLFRPYGNIQISWLSETSAYVALYNKENAAIAQKALCQHIGSFHIVSYAAHQLSKSSCPLTPTLLKVSANKRKLGDDGINVQQKVRRHSLSDSVSTAYDNVNNNAETESDNVNSSIAADSDQTERIHNNSCNDSIAENTPEKVQEKLFDESGTW